MKKIKIGQIGLGHTHGEEKMIAVRRFPELFEASSVLVVKDSRPIDLVVYIFGAPPKKIVYKI